jgi:hypothetical protein
MQEAFALLGSLGVFGDLGHCPHQLRQQRIPPESQYPRGTLCSEMLGLGVEERLESKLSV